MINTHVIQPTPSDHQGVVDVKENRQNYYTVDQRRKSTTASELDLESVAVRKRVRLSLMYGNLASVIAGTAVSWYSVNKRQSGILNEFAASVNIHTACGGKTLRKFLLQPKNLAERSSPTLFYSCDVNITKTTFRYLCFAFKFVCQIWIRRWSTQGECPLCRGHLQ